MATTSADSAQRRLFQTGLSGASGGNDANGTAGGVLQPVPRPSVSANVDPMNKAAREINKFLQADESYPDLDTYCRREWAEGGGRSCGIKMLT